MDNVAIYWDFENLHASLVDEREGEGAYGKTWYRPQPALVEVRPVLDYAASIGRIVVNRAYANWQHLAKYRTKLLENAVDLVQMFPLVGSKNGADIRLAIDVVEDLHLLPHVSHVVIVGSDSDFVSLAQRCKRAGRTVVGVGVQRSTAPWWSAACDDYRLYNALLVETSADTSANGQISAPALEDVGDLEDARALLAKAIRNLAPDDAQGWVIKGAVRPMMKRLDPSFDPIVLGYRSFNAFLGACKDLVNERAGEHDRELALRADHGADAQGGRPALPDRPRELSAYELTLKDLRIRLPPREHLWRSAEITAAVFGSEPVLQGFPELDRELQARLAGEGISVDEHAARQLRQVQYKAHMFRLLGPNGIGLDPKVVEDPVGFVQRWLLRTLLTNAQPPHDLGELSEVVLGADTAVNREHVTKLRNDLTAAHHEGTLEAPDPSDPQVVGDPSDSPSSQV